MNIFTTGYEFMTAITNIIITMLSCYVCYKLNRNVKNRKWVFFFLLLSVAGFMGVLIHGIAFKKAYIRALWFILSLIFTLAITTLVYLFVNNKKYGYRNIIITSIIVYLVFFLEMVAEIDFLTTFIIYAALCIIFSLIILIRRGIKENIYFIIALLIQIIGGIFLLLSIRIPKLLLDENSIYHLFMFVSIIFLSIGAYKKRWQK